MRSAYSATVEIRLVVEGSFLNIAQVGPSFAIRRNSVHRVPAGYGRLDVVIDGEVTSSSVYLPDGIAEGMERFECVATKGCSDKDSPLKSTS